MEPSVEVEYCGTCGYAQKFHEMKEVLMQKRNVKITGFEGRRASFEVKVNGTLVHSKLSTMAFPDFQDVLNIVEDIENGKVARMAKQQPITNCVLL